MKAVERYLYSRDGYYYFRKSFPQNLQALLPFRETWLGLGTQELGVARIQVAQLDHEYTRLLNELRYKLSDLSPEKSPERVLHDFISAIDTLKDNYGYEPSTKFNHLKTRGKNGKGLLFSQIVKEYLKDCSTDTQGTRFHKENTYGLFIELMGDTVFRDIGVNEAKKFKSILMKIPANAKTLYKIESFNGIDLSKLKGKPQHPKTINNRLTFLVTLFNWAIRGEHYHDSNPFSNVLIRGKKVTETRRHPFRAEELQALFRSEQCRGSKYPSMFWVPLIGLYSGMRLNEICQLSVEDIRQEEGLYIFDVNDDGQDKSLKTVSSRRKIPVHKELIKHGLFDYMDQIKAQRHKRLFPDIPLGKCTKTYSSAFTKRFWRLLNALEIKREGLCFHSLRHTFIDGMRNAGVERSIVMAITGHQSSKDVHDAYGYGYNLSILQKGINKLTFPVI
jgi:integrase